MVHETFHIPVSICLSGLTFYIKVYPFRTHSWSSYAVLHLWCWLCCRCLRCCLYHPSLVNAYSASRTPAKAWLSGGSVLQTFRFILNSLSIYLESILTHLLRACGPMSSAHPLRFTPSRVRKWSRSVMSNSFATPQTVAYKASPSMGFSRQECWSGLPFPSPGVFPNPGIEPSSPAL